MATKLLREGRKLAVLGCAPGDLDKWHIVRPGSYSIPQLSGEAGTPGLTVARSLCGLYVYSNAYPPDWRPPEGSLCPACAERN